MTTTTTTTTTTAPPTTTTAPPTTTTAPPTTTTTTAPPTTTTTAAPQVKGDICLGVSADSGKTLAATLQRESDDFYWNNVTEVWESASTFANKKISLAEGTTENLGSYTGNNFGNAGDALDVLVRYHDDADVNNKTIAMERLFVLNGKKLNNVDAISRNTQPADALKRLMLGAFSFAIDTATLAATTTVFETDLNETADNTLVDQAIKFSTGPNAGLTSRISASQGKTANPNNKVKLTVVALPAVPNNADQAIIFGRVRS